MNDDNDFSLLRGERRSFFCSNRLWNELLSHLGEDVSASNFIRSAVVEKLSVDNPSKRDFFESLLSKSSRKS